MSNIHPTTGLLEHDIDTTRVTMHDVNVAITERLIMFHKALCDRGQIKPILSDQGPKVVS